MLKIIMTVSAGNMDIKKKFSILIFVWVMLLFTYFTYLFLKVEPTRNEPMGNHHKTSITSFLIISIHAFFWGIFVLGLFQVKSFLDGKDRLGLVSFIFGGLSAYLLLIVVDAPAALNDKNAMPVFNELSIVVLCGVMLVFSWSTYAKVIHNQSKIENQAKFRNKLGI